MSWLYKSRLSLALKKGVASCYYNVVLQSSVEVDQKEVIEDDRHD